MLQPLLIVFSLLFLHQFAFAQTINSDQSEVRFEISNTAFNTVEGTFKNMNGIINFDPNDLANASFDVCVAAQTVDTGNSKRDEHLRKEDFFYVAQYPKICFVSRNITQREKDYLATGQLTLRGVTKPVKIPFTFANQQFTGNFTIDRYDFLVGGNSSFLVGKEVQMTIDCAVE